MRHLDARNLRLAKSHVLAFTASAAIAAATLIYRRELLQLFHQRYAWLLSMQSTLESNWLTFALVQTIVAATGILPASFIAVMAGASLGFGWGLAISATSTVLGGWIAFLLSRSALRDVISRHVHRHAAAARLDDAMSAEGWRLVLLLRISPVMPFALTSYGLGLTRIAQRDFLLGTLASLPALTGYVMLGSLGKQGLAMAGSGGTGLQWLALGFGILAVTYAAVRVRKALALATVA